MLRSTVAWWAVLLAAACYHGPNLETFDAAHGPDGIFAELRLRRNTVRGELLEVQDTALIVLTDAGSVVLVPVERIRRGTFAQRGVLIDDGYGAARTMAQLRNLSRFPGGMTPEIRARLLAAYGQTEVRVAQ